MRTGAVLLVLVLTFSTSALAQTETGSPPASAELVAGYAGFLDNAIIGHGIVGGSASWYLSPRVAIGPELVYMRGPWFDRDLFLTGNLRFDLVKPGAPGVVPFLVVGGGLFRHSERFSGTPFSSSEGALTGGGGIRAWLTDRVYGLVELRTGWEPHVRVNGGVGVVLNR